MPSILFTILSFVFVLGVMILVHEFGHFAAAKLLRIRVETFSIGFGPRLFGFRKGNTDYRIALLPLGGYVKMTGENPDETITGSPEEFLSRPKTHRLAVILAGPLMNVALAVLLLTAYFVVGAQVPAYKSQPAVIGVVAPGAPADQAGILPNDKIVRLEGKQDPTWEDVELAVLTSPRQELRLVVERDGQLIEKTVVPKVIEEVEAGYIGVGPFVPQKVGRVEPGTPAARAGLQAGDEVIQVTNPTGKAASGYYAITELARQSQGIPLIYKVKRGETVLEMTIVPTDIAGQVRTGFIAEFQMVTRKFGPLEALRESLFQNYKMTLLTYRVLGKILTGRASIKSMSGPIDIARLSGTFAAEGALSLINFMAIISLNLAIFNLLPIPILDGGVMALILVEALIGRDLSLKAKERIFQLGFIFLVLLMGVVLFNDIAKNLPAGWLGR